MRVVAHAGIEAKDLKCWHRLSGARAVYPYLLQLYVKGLCAERPGTRSFCKILFYLTIDKASKHSC